MHSVEGAIEMRAKGYPVKDVSHQYADTLVVGFPTCLDLVNEMSDRNLCTASEASPAQQYHWLQKLEKHWLGGDRQNGQVSYTLKWRKELVSYEDYIDILLQFQPTVKCCTLIPELAQDASAYAYLPEEPISAQRYRELVAEIERVEMEAYDSASLMCEGGACPIEMNIHAESVGVIAEAAD